MSYRDSESILLKVLKWVFVTLLGVVASTLGIIQFYFEKTPEVEFEVLSEVNVLDIKSDLSKLDILYGGSSLKQQRLALKIFNIKFINNGGADILLTSYDIADPVGFTVNPGQIIEEPEILSASNDYIRGKVKIERFDMNSFFIKPIIIEPKENIVIKVLVMSQIDSNPIISAFGKIAGQKSIQVKQYLNGAKKSNYFKVAFQGGFVVQLIRIIFFLILFGILLAILIAVASGKDAKSAESKP